ncbi:Protein of unknown function [Pyronema omphalodes CBS 100304]|uniref:Uncharacterized protein n=1 Tax=Pyronema omphalodes (strain CBS 100304) TaxID=1076935 RepID=U4KVE4_PYROM|nr:Protein of unknown function [Pyronema omphalodes CBS 100304]
MDTFKDSVRSFSSEIG